MRTPALALIFLCAAASTSQAAPETSPVLLVGQGIRAALTAPDGLSWVSVITAKEKKTGTATLLRLVDRTTKMTAKTEFTLFKGCHNPSKSRKTHLSLDGPVNSKIRIYAQGEDFELDACLRPVLDMTTSDTSTFQIQGTIPGYLGAPEAFATTLLTEIGQALEKNEPAGTQLYERFVDFDWTRIGMAKDFNGVYPDSRVANEPAHDKIGQVWHHMSSNTPNFWAQLAPYLGNEIIANRIFDYPKGCTAYLEAKASKLEESELRSFDKLPEGYSKSVIYYPKYGIENETYKLSSSPSHSFDTCFDVPGGLVLVNIKSPLDMERAVHHIEPMLTFLTSLDY